MLFAGSCHCAAKHAMEKGPPTASCRKWHFGHGLVPQIANQRNANEWQRHVMWWEHRDYVWYMRHGKKKFFSVGPTFFRTRGGGPPQKNIPPGIKKFYLPPPWGLQGAHSLNGSNMFMVGQLWPVAFSTYPSHKPLGLWYNLKFLIKIHVL